MPAESILRVGSWDRSRNSHTQKRLQLSERLVSIRFASESLKGHAEITWACLLPTCFQGAGSDSLPSIGMET